MLGLKRTTFLDKLRRHDLDQLGVPPERCVFIDDRASNCDAARASGIRAVKFDGVDSLVASLRDEGLRP